MNGTYTISWTDGAELVEATTNSSAAAGVLATQMSRERGTVGYVLVKVANPELTLGVSEFRYEWGRLSAFVQYGDVHMVDEVFS